MRKISDMLADPKLRHRDFLLFWMFSSLPLLATLRAVGALSFRDENYSHIAVVPVISIFMIYVERRRIFRNCRFCPQAGFPFVFLGAILYVCINSSAASLPSGDRLSLAVFAVVVMWVASFVLFYGTQAAKAAKFPFLFSLLMIPIPAILLKKIIVGLQYGSADVTDVLLRLAGIPVFRQGLEFSLPGINIQVAEACSGIHSSLALMIVGILAGHFCLESTWRKIMLGLLTIPISIIKNALRIAVISGLGIYVDRGFFYGALHRHSGYPFALVALAMLGPVLIVLRRSEANSTMKRAANHPVNVA
jgi:exosortase